VEPADAALLDRLQTDLPLVERPWAELASALGTSEDDVLRRVRALRARGIIRQVSAIFDTRRLGYTSLLVAARTSKERQDDAAAVFSAHPGVTHNYEREHDFNLWFTLAVPPNSTLGVDGTLSIMQDLSGAETIRPMPALRFFKIGVDLDVTGGRDPAAKAERRGPSKPTPPPGELTDRDIAAIRALQTDLPTESEPFGHLAHAYGFAVPELLAAGHEFLATGQMRRFAAVLAHRRAGFVQNGMGVWKVDEDSCAEMGARMAAYRGVSHCYQRPVFPDWPYRLFSMTHGRDREECEAVLRAISEDTGLSDYAVLYSTREYKKTRLTYFTPDLDRWEATHAPLLAEA
jgi:DNA-binding Lrp family transcriptional regulator